MVRTILATLVGGIAMWLTSFVLHGLVMANTYIGLPEVFSQEQANPLSFLILEILIAFPAVILFTKTRSCWTAGLTGGLMFAFWLGLVGSFAQLFSPLVIAGFPYYLGWCWFGINMIVALVLGVVLGLMIKKA